VKNRNRTEIIRQIIEITNDYDLDKGITRTKLMHKAYLSSAQLKEYLALLTAHRLLTHNSAVRRFRVTEKGLQFLEIYYKLSDMLSEEEEEVDYAELPRM